MPQYTVSRSLRLAFLVHAAIVILLLTTTLEATTDKIVGDPVHRIASFEVENPLAGVKALRIDESYAVMDAAQDWTGYDYIKPDIHTDAEKPLQLYFEVRDTAIEKLR